MPEHILTTAERHAMLRNGPSHATAILRSGIAFVVELPEGRVATLAGWRGQPHVILIHDPDGAGPTGFPSHDLSRAGSVILLSHWPRAIHGAMAALAARLGGCCVLVETTPAGEPGWREAAESASRVVTVVAPCEVCGVSR